MNMEDGVLRCRCLVVDTSSFVREWPVVLTVTKQEHEELEVLTHAM